MTLAAVQQRWFGLLVFSFAVFSGCHRSDHRRQTESLTAPKSQVYSYLAQKTGQTEFAPGIDFDLPNHIATLRSNATSLEHRTLALRASIRAAVESKDPADERNRLTIERDLQELELKLEAARAEVTRKQDELSNQEDVYIRSIRERMAGVGSYEALYRLIGEQLATADRLLAEPAVSRRRMGLKMAEEACRHANSDSVDVWLAARICEAYFWPNLDWIDSAPDARERALALLETSRRVFFNTYETNSVLTNYYHLLSRAPNAGATDTFRVQLADWLEEKGNLKRAAEILDEIRDPEVLASASERITRVKNGAAMSIRAE
jgi:hypothetical protein